MPPKIPEAHPTPSLRARVYAQLEASARTRGLSVINRILVGLILVSTALAITETESSFSTEFGQLFAVAELALGSLFALEYLARVWVAPERKPKVSPWSARLRFVFSISALADLAAVIASFAPVTAVGVVLLRWIRLARIFRLAKLGRMSRAMEHMVSAVSSRRDELVLSLILGLALMIAAATALYLAEGAAQPDKFGSIPRALWWSVATMTTIGYGDVYPITTLGKMLAAVTALFSIGLIAMPTGILAAAFSDAMERHRREQE